MSGLLVPERHFFVESAGARLACFDLGGSGQAALLLHGLYGASHEWRKTASWLKHSFHVFALDQRGHGKSSKGLNEGNLDNLALDVVSVIEHLGFPVLLIGQSFGGLVALIVAGRRPEIVARLVLIEVHASSGPSGTSWLLKWPASFPSRGAAIRFFESQGLDAETWFQGLQERCGSYWPRFSRSDVLEMEKSLHIYDYRPECAMIRASTLVVAGSNSWLDPKGTRAVAGLIPGARYAEIGGAGHDVHLDRPNAFRDVVRTFLEESACS